jgi:hypothetical protein
MKDKMGELTMIINKQAYTWKLPNSFLSRLRQNIFEIIREQEQKLGELKMKTKNEIKDFKGIALKGKFCSCGKPATLTYAESYMDFTHGGRKSMCDHCYNNILRKTAGYELGKEETEKRLLSEVRRATEVYDYNEFLKWLYEKEQKLVRTEVLPPHAEPKVEELK